MLDSLTKERNPLGSVPSEHRIQYGGSLYSLRLVPETGGLVLIACGLPNPSGPGFLFLRMRNQRVETNSGVYYLTIMALCGTMIMDQPQPHREPEMRRNGPVAVVGWQDPAGNEHPFSRPLSVMEGRSEVSYLRLKFHELVDSYRDNDWNPLDEALYGAEVRVFLGVA